MRLLIENAERKTVRSRTLRDRSYESSPKGIHRRKRYYYSPKGKKTWQKFAKSPKARDYRKRHRQENRQIEELKQSLKALHPLKDGYPDDGILTEVKIAGDYIRFSQFRRFAWMQRWHGKIAKIRVAASKHECMLGHFRDISIPEFLTEVCGQRSPIALKLWSKLVRKIGQKIIN